MLSICRPSVYIEVRRRPANCGGGNTVVDSYMTCLEPLLTELQEKEESYPRTIVYMPLKWCGYGHEQALDFLEDCSTFQPVHQEEDEEVKSFVAQYHAPQTPEVSLNILFNNRVSMQVLQSLIFVFSIYKVVFMGILTKEVI